MPSIEDLKMYLEEYGWKYRETKTEDGAQFLIAPYALQAEPKGVLISFRVQGEFVIVSTIDFLINVPENFAKNLLSLNDRLKLVKLYSVSSESVNTFDVEVGFELWNESWNKETFFCFMDMLGLGIEKILNEVETQQIIHDTNFVSFT